MTERILIVEDNPQNMRLVLMALRPHGYTLLEVVNGEEALETATKDKPDIILMDIDLPKLSGLEVARRLKGMRTFSHIPIIVLTAYATKGEKGKAIEAGCHAYLSKPINTRELVRVVADTLSWQERANTSD